MSKYNEEELENFNNCSYSPKIDKVTNFSQLEEVKTYLIKDYPRASDEKILELIKQYNMEESAKVVLFSLLDRKYDFTLDLDFLLSVEKYIQNKKNLHSIIKDKFKAYVLIRKNQLSSIFDEYALDIAEELSNIGLEEKLIIIKQILNIKKITAEIEELNIINYPSNLQKLFSELQIKIEKFDSKVLYVMDISKPIPQKIVLNEGSMVWELDEKGIQKINSWLNRISDVVSNLSISSFVNAEKKKIAIGALALGLSVSTQNANADMISAANNLESLGNMLSERIGQLDDAGECKIGTRIIKKTKHSVEANIYFGDYRIDVRGSGYDAGVSKSSDVHVKIARLKKESDCVLDYSQAKVIANTVKNIVKNQ